MRSLLMKLLFLPVVLLLSGCAIVDALGTGFSAVGDGTKYLVDKMGSQGQPGTAPAGGPTPARAESRVDGGGPLITPAPTDTIEVVPLD